MEGMSGADRFGRPAVYSVIGFCVGLLAPIGWLIVRMILFGQEGEGLGAALSTELVSSPLNRALYGYMGGGTALVLGTFGFFIGRASEQIRGRARSLDDLNREIRLQKEEFEKRFNTLNSGIKNFHVINTHIQKTQDPREVMNLAADGLHGVLGYDRVNIFLVDPVAKTMTLAAQRAGEGQSRQERLELPLDSRAGALYKAVAEKRAFLVDDMRKMPDDYQLQPPCDQVKLLRSRSFILCPIIVLQEVVGLLGVDNKLSHSLLGDSDLDTVKLFADQVAGNLTKLNLLEAVDSLTRELNGTFGQLLPYRSEYERLDGALKTASSSTGEAIREIAGAADVVRDAVDATRSSAGEISVSIQQVAENLKRLSEFIDSSIGSMTEIAATVHSVEESAVRSHQMSETVRQKSQGGAASVGRAIAGLQGIAESVEHAVANIDQLARTGEEAGSITTVISEITQKTNLLALNAAIIAAQAGEHGRSFAVVAQEVGALSREAAASTEAIARLIEDMQAATRETVASIVRSRDLVQDGLHLGRDLEDALREILESTELAMNMALDIRRSTGEVTRSAEAVHQSIIRLGEMSSQVSQASREEAQGIRNIVHSIEEVKSMAEDMVSATDRQRQNTLAIDRSVAQVSQMAERIFAAMEQRQEESLEVLEKLEVLRRQENEG